MPYKNGNKVWNETVWTKGMISFLTKNYQKKTNPQLADHLGLRLTTVRTKLYELGFKRMELQYWTKPQITFLRNNYKKIGDIEIAEIFTCKWYKEKGWKRGQIEKKRRYLKLKRTPSEIKKIHTRNKKLGRFKICPIKAWITRGGAAPEKTIRWWKPKTGYEIPVIKISGKWIHWNRYAWIKHFGAIAPGMNVTFKNGNTRDLRIKNLELISDVALAAKNSGATNLSDNYIIGIIGKGNKILKQELLNNPELIDLKRTQLLLNRELIKHEQSEN